MRSIFGFILILLVIISCEPSVFFRGAQPEGVASLPSIPNKIWGDFVSENGESRIKISKVLIIKTIDYDFKIHKDSIGKDYRLSGDTLYDKESSNFEIVSIRNDSIITHVNQVDTLFSLSDKNILKKFKGYYFLNFACDSDYWRVQKMEFHKGILSISSISVKDEIDNLRQLTEDLTDTTSFRFNITRKQFKKFIKNNGFSDSELYKKIKNTR